jgi:hypothetical protein
MFFNNPLALIVGLNAFKNNNNVSKSERNKALLFSLFIKDPTGAVLTADLAAKKAVNEADLKEKQAELNISRNLADATIQLAEEAMVALENIKLVLDPNVINDIGDLEKLKQHITDNATPHLSIQLPKEIRNAIISARPDLSPVAPMKASELSGIKALLKQ